MGLARYFFLSLSSSPSLVLFLSDKKSVFFSKSDRKIVENLLFLYYDENTDRNTLMKQAFNLFRLYLRMAELFIKYKKERIFL